MTGPNGYGRVVLTAALLMLAAASPAGAAGGLQVQPEVVAIDNFFSGVQMHVACDLPPGSQAVLAIRGERTEAELMRKTHHWDLWMNSGEVDIDHVPWLYIALSSDPGLLEAGSGVAPWGYGAIEREASFSGRMNSPECDTIFNQFVALKERDELYRLYPGGLSISQDGTGPRGAEGGFQLPSRLKAGIYHVTLWIVQDGRITQTRNAAFEVRLKGVPAFLHTLAQRHGALYGFFAAAIAMAAGLFIGLMFHHGDGHH